MLLAHQLAFASPLISADCVEATEFPHLSGRYNVFGVPRTIINEYVQVEGAVPEKTLVSELLTVLDAKRMDELKAHWAPRT